MGIATLRLILTAAAVVLLTVGAQAQSPAQGAGGVTGGDFGGSHHRRGNSKKVETAKPKIDEKGYKAALDQLPDKQYDAWHGVR
ncbi:MAG: hypothetical protein WAV27_26635 [Xanthobacteraceae bacterium]|jgi:hypothetical protein